MSEVATVDKVREAVEFLKAGVRGPKQIFRIPLPGEEWEDFANTDRFAEWRSVPVETGRAIMLRTKGQFHFGFHSHRAITENLRLIEGFCLFGEGEMQFLEPGQSATVLPQKRHALRMLKKGLARVWWPDLDDDFVEVVS